jgi:cold shock CspA family protein
MNGFGNGKIKRMYRGLGIGIIEPKDKPDEEVFFSERAVQGGRRGFERLGEGDKVRYRQYPQKIGDKDWADDVWTVSRP